MIFMVLTSGSSLGRRCARFYSTILRRLRRWSVAGHAATLASAGAARTVAANP
jgi:hypothetical protein